GPAAPLFRPLASQYRPWQAAPLLKQPDLRRRGRMRKCRSSDRAEQGLALFQALRSSIANARALGSPASALRPCALMRRSAGGAFAPSLSRLGVTPTRRGPSPPRGCGGHLARLVCLVALRSCCLGRLRGAVGDGDANARRAARVETERAGGSVRHVDDAALRIWPAIVDADRNAAAILEECHAHH